MADKAVELGLISREQLAEKREEELVDLIFSPGLSTAEKVTDVSGRGVGMDVVKTKITELGGTVQIHTAKDEGTTFTIMLPVTVSIIQTLMVEVGKEIYAIPTGYVDSTISLAPQDIKIIRNQEVTMFRGEVLPLIRLQNLLDIPEAKNKDLAELDVVVIRVGDRQVGCIVDSLLRPQDVVTKPLGSYLGNVPGISGATILGDGRVALILDFRAVA
ncbi:MAG TPA: chemotaxis protein CheW [Bacillota bacterium]|nr:chemotaxis protein CheW [Bacillota bacterium]